MRVGGQRHTTAALPRGNSSSTHFIEGWVDNRAGLDMCGKSGSNRNSIPEPSSRCVDVTVGKYST
jgi:hypothetical protein